jgi:hypothetical protein
MTIYREKLWPAPWLFISTALVIPASLLVFLPINQTVGIVVAIVLYLGCLGLLILASPMIEVTGTDLVAGKARIPIAAIGEVTAHHAEGARMERGQRLDARAWLLIRGWVDPVIKVEVRDDADPTPYWLVSTRKPEAVIAALAELRPRTPGK